MLEDSYTPRHSKWVLVWACCVLSFSAYTQSNIKYGLYSVIPGVGQLANPDQPPFKGWLFMGST